LLNPDDTNDATVDISFYQEDGTFIKTESNVEIDTYNTLSFQPDDYSVTEESGMIFIDSDTGLVGTVIRESDYSATSEPLQDAGPTSSGDRYLYCPKFVQQGDWDTYICLFHYYSGGTSASVDFKFYSTDGTYIDTYSTMIGSRETFYKKPTDMGINNEYGNILIEADNVNSGEIFIGYTLRTDGDTSYSEPLPRSLTTEAVSNFGKYDKGGTEIDTNIVINNPTSSSMNLDFEFYKYDGTSLGEEIQSIAAHATFTIDPTEYIDCTIGSVYCSSSNGYFIGYSYFGGTMGAGFSTELMTNFNEELYSPNIQEPDSESGGFHTEMWITNTDDDIIEIDVEFFETDGTSFEEITDLELLENSVATIYQEPGVELDGSVIIASPGYDYLSGWIFGRIIDPLLGIDCKNCFNGDGCNWGQNDCLCYLEDCGGLAYCGTICKNSIEPPGDENCEDCRNDEGCSWGENHCICTTYNICEGLTLCDCSQQNCDCGNRCSDSQNSCGY
jgi:hypothetical protein